MKKHNTSIELTGKVIGYSILLCLAILIAGSILVLAYQSLNTVTQ